MNSRHMQQPSRKLSRASRIPVRSSAARPSAAGPAPLGKAGLRLLSALAEDGIAALPDPTRDGTVILRGGQAGISLGRGSHALAEALDLTARDLAAVSGDGAARKFTITDSGRAHLRRRAAATEPFRAQQQELVAAEIRDESGTSTVAMNAAESPLDWLHRRRGAAGEALIDQPSYEAGERLRRDMNQACLLPSVTARWEGAMGAGAGPRDPAGANDSVVAARQRMRAALAAVGPDYADLLVDLCGFLKGLEVIERERRWPARSAKVVVRFALRRLADYYGLGSEAAGPQTSRGIRAWHDRLGEMG